jgi:hypothetical protein
MNLQSGEEEELTWLQRGVAKDDGALCWTTTLPPLASVSFLLLSLFPGVPTVLSSFVFSVLEMIELRR